MSMCSYNHCHGVCSCETHTLSSCIRTAVGRSSSNKTWIPWTRWWNHVVCPLSCECLGACFSLFLFWGEGKDEWKQHGWQGFLSRTLAWPSCAIDIDWLYHVWRGLFHGVSFFFRASDHQQFQEQDVETHSATFRSKCGDTCTNAWSPKAKQHRSLGFSSMRFFVAQTWKMPWCNKKNVIVADWICWKKSWIQLIEASCVFFGMAIFSEIGVSNWFGDTIPTKTPKTSGSWLTDHFLEGMQQIFGPETIEENLLRNTISQGLQREVARSRLC